MRLCVIYTGTASTAWSCGDGIVSTLRRLGHTVLAVPRGRPECPALSIEALNGADLILISAAEWIFGTKELSFFNKREVSLYEWLHEVKTPKAFWYTESAHREDRNFAYDKLLSYADQHFFPAIQDAEMYDDEHFAKGRSHWLPFGVDTEVFRPAPCPSCHGKNMFLLKRKQPETPNPTIKSSVPSLVDPGAFEKTQCKVCLGTGLAPRTPDLHVGFIGMMYDKRQAFIHNLGQHMNGEKFGIHCGSVYVVDIDGVPWEEQARRLCANYRRCAIFLNMPHLSELLVTKILEVMSSGVFLMTPAIPGSGERNMDMLTHASEVVFYQPTNLPFVVQTIREFLARPEMMDRIAMTGMHKVRTEHSLELRLKQLFEVMFKAQPFEVPSVGVPEIAGIIQ